MASGSGAGGGGGRGAGKGKSSAAKTRAASQMRRISSWEKTRERARAGAIASESYGAPF